MTRASRAERVMAVVRWILLSVVATIAAHSVYVYAWRDSGHAESQRDRYYCPMHPEIRSHDPGECPICHMRLEPIPSGLTTAAPSPMLADAGAGATFAAPPPGLDPVMVSLDRQQSIGVATTLVVSEALTPTLRASAVVSPREGSTSEVRVRSPSFVERVVVRETGARVGRGQTLAFIYSPDVARARDDLRLAERWRAGAPETPNPTDIVAASRRSLSRLGVAAGDVDGALHADEAVPTVPLRAPAGGVVTRFAASEGTFATPETVLYEITNLSRVWVIATVPERDSGAVTVGAEVRFTADGHAASTGGEIVRIEPFADPETRAIRIRIEVPNRDLALRPGQVGTVDFEGAPADMLAVPRESVIDTGTNRYVFVVRGETFEARTVEVGITVGDRVAIVRGLAVGERVVTRGGFLLDSESRLAASLRAGPRDEAPP